MSDSESVVLGSASSARRFVAVASLALFVAGVAGCYESHVDELGPRQDGGSQNDAGSQSDAGATVACDDETLPAHAGPPCSAEVNACRSACGADEACLDACLDDPCRECVLATIFHCANEAGCEPLWQAFACCVEGTPGCTELEGFDRATCAAGCPMELDPYTQCVQTMGGAACFERAASDCELR